MKFGVFLPHFGPLASPGNLVRIAQTAEAQGWHSLWWGDHVVIPRNDPKPVATTQRFGATFFETLTTMAYVAAATQRIRLGTSVLIAPYRHPLMLAKQFATLDQLSGGRVTLGIAAGWMEQEFDILGLPFRQRGRMTDECVAAIRACWASEQPVFEGKHFAFRDVAFSPRPVQQPLPIWIGGDSEAALRRAVRLGDAWDPISSVNAGLSFDELGAMIAKGKGWATEEGRDPDSLTWAFHAQLRFDTEPGAFADKIHFIGSTDEIRRALGQAQALGVSHLVLTSFYRVPEKMEFTDLDDLLRTLERFATEVMPEFAD